jgi:apolipoprotein N-acyltransferase
MRKDAMMLGVRTLFDKCARWISGLAEMTLLRKSLHAFAFGFAGALAFPPTGFFPILVLSFPALIALLRSTANARSAFVVGWSFAFGYFLLGLYWIAAAMFVDIGAFWWAVPLAVAGLPAMCAIYYGVAAAAARRIGLDGLAGALLFALLWFLADYARGHLLTGFPWNLEGYVWSDVLPMMQLVSLTGIYGLTLITLVVACLPAALVDKSWSSRFVVTLGVIVLLGIAAWGGERLLAAKETSTSVRVRVVQPNIEQAHKWNVSERERHFQQLLDYTAAPAEKPLAAIIWPETASTFYLEEDTSHRRAIAASLSLGAVVLTGVIRRNLGDDGRMHFANSLVAIDRSGRIASAYDKFHLVPFGEYIPFRRILPLRTLANLGVDFTPGEGGRTLHMDALPAFSPLVCYEAIFPGEVARRDDRPQLLVNITNDGWYGRTAGPYQHFASARARAIEEGVPLVRSANTGISGVIDGYGRIVAKLGLSVTGYVDADLPPALSPTVFSRYGEKPLWFLFAGFAVLAVAARWVCSRPRRHAREGSHPFS